MLTDVIVLVMLVILSGFFSAAGLAYVISNKIKIEIKARKKNVAAQAALHFTQNPQAFYSTILLSVNTVNITFASLIAIFLATVFGYDNWTILVLASLIILFFGELFPRYFAREIPDKIILISALPVRVVSIILYPLVRIIASMSEFLSKSETIKEESLNLLFNRQEIQLLLKESQESGVVNPRESDIINRIIQLGDQRVYEVMRPRTEIVGVEISSTIEELLDVFIESGYSKLPVYEDNLDNIKGVAIAYDLFRGPQNLSDIIRNVIFVPDTKKSIEMLKEFLQRRITFAVAIDEFGGTAGILTMEDIIEELFGEIRDEYDTDDEICRKTADDTYVIGGKVEIDYIHDTLGIIIPEGGYATIGGYITSNIGRIPEKGEKIILDRFQILILRSNQIRIELVKITLLPEE